MYKYFYLINGKYKSLYSPFILYIPSGYRQSYLSTSLLFSWSSAFSTSDCKYKLSFCSNFPGNLLSGQMLSRYSFLVLSDRTTPVMLLQLVIQVPPFYDEYFSVFTHRRNYNLSFCLYIVSFSVL